MPARAIVLGNEGGEGIAEILHRHIGEGVDLDRRRKRRHDFGPEAVDPALDHQNAEVHNGLLGPRHKRQTEHMARTGLVPAHVPAPHPQVGAGQKGIGAQTKPRQPLGNDRRPRRTGDPGIEPQHKGNVQHNVEEGCRPQKNQRPHRVPHCPQQAGIIIVEKGPADPQENHHQIIPHQVPDFRGDLQQRENGIGQGKGSDVEHQRRQPDHAEGEKNLPPHTVLFSPSEGDGHRHSAAHGQSQQNGGQKGHEGVGGPYRRQGIGAHEPADNEGIRNIIQLLQQISQHHGKGKPQQCGGDGPAGQRARCSAAHRHTSRPVGLLFCVAAPFICAAPPLLYGRCPACWGQFCRPGRLLS